MLVKVSQPVLISKSLEEQPPLFCSQDGKTQQEGPYKNCRKQPLLCNKSLWESVRTPHLLPCNFPRPLMSSPQHMSCFLDWNANVKGIVYSRSWGNTTSQQWGSCCPDASLLHWCPDSMGRPRISLVFREGSLVLIASSMQKPHTLTSLHKQRALLTAVGQGWIPNSYTKESHLEWHRWCCSWWDEEQLHRCLCLKLNWTQLSRKWCDAGRHQLLQKVSVDDGREPVAWCLPVGCHL